VHSTFEVIKYIIDKGINLEYTTDCGQKPIHIINTRSESVKNKYMSFFLSFIINTKLYLL